MTAPAGVHHIAVMVRSLAAVEPFYRDILGLPIIRRWPAADGQGDRSVWLDAGGGAFVALEVAASGGPPDPQPRPGWHLVALRIAVTERPVWLRRLAAAGVVVYQQTPHTLYVRDPEGNRVGLSHWPEAAAHADDHV